MLTASLCYTINTNEHDKISQTDIISTNKQSINAEFPRNIGNKFLLWTYMYTTINFLGKHVIQTNPPKLDERLFSHIIIFVQITFETRNRNTVFYVLRQGVPEGRSSNGYASFKQVKSWAWHVEIIPGVSVV